MDTEVVVRARWWPHCRDHGADRPGEHHRSLPGRDQTALSCCSIRSAGS